MKQEAVMRFTGKVVVVTGAGSGIGKATAQRFVAEGASVVAADIDQARLEALTAEAGAAGAQVWGVQTDLGRRDECERLIDTTQSRFGRVDILVNNAAIMDRFLPVAELTDELWERVLAVNLNGVMYTMRRAIPLMLAQGRGVIVNIASAAAFGGGFAGAAYTTSKHAVIGLTKNTAVMYGKQGLRCVAVCPGAVNTGIPLGGTPSELGYGALKPELGTIPRVGEPVELANAILMVAGDDASFINGAVLAVDGGWTAQG
jgi:NAD(P)-dependent dehydrogenase (short-subunit alcohol dehydrogenase family)